MRSRLQRSVKVFSSSDFTPISARRPDAVQLPPFTWFLGSVCVASQCLPLWWFLKNSLEWDDEADDVGGWVCESLASSNPFSLKLRLYLTKLSSQLHGVEDFRSFWSAFYMHSMLMTPVITLEFLWLSTSYVIGCLCHLLVCIILILNQESDAAHHIVRACNEPCTWNNFCHFILKRTHHDLHVYYL